MNNPYYDEKLKSLEATLKRILEDNKEIEAQNIEIKATLQELENEINTNYEEISKMIEPFKSS